MITATLVALFQTKLFRATPGDHTFNVAFPDLDDNMSHDVAKRDFSDFTFELVPC